MYLYDIILLSNHRQFIVPTSILTSFFLPQKKHTFIVIFIFYKNQIHYSFFYKHLEIFSTFLKMQLSGHGKWFLTNYKIWLHIKRYFWFLNFSYLRSLFWDEHIKAIKYNWNGMWRNWKDNKMEENRLKSLPIEFDLNEMTNGMS